MKSCQLIVYTVLSLLIGKSSGDGIRGLAIGINVCPICGVTGIPTDLEAIVEVPESGNFTCLELETSGNAGLFDEDKCSLIQLLADDECGCEEATGAPTEEPTVSPVSTGTPTVVAETPEPTTAETPAPAADETPEPTAAEIPEPTAAETPEPTAAETPEPTSAETPEPTSDETPEPTSDETLEPTNIPPADPTTISPTVSPTPGEDPDVTVVVTIFFDDYAPETGWSIEYTNGTIIKDVPIGTYLPQTTFSQTPVTLLGGQEYVFTIRDLFGDGMSNPEDGNFTVAQENVTLVSGGGNFGFTNSTVFTTLL